MCCRKILCRRATWFFKKAAVPLAHSTKLHYQRPNYKDQATLSIRPEQIIRDKVHGPNVSRGRSKVRWKRTACLKRWSARPPRPRSTRARPLVYTRDRRTDLRDGRRRKKSTTNGRCPPIRAVSGRCYKNVPVLLGGDARYYLKNIYYTII